MLLVSAAYSVNSGHEGNILYLSGDQLIEPKLQMHLQGIHDSLNNRTMLHIQTMNIRDATMETDLANFKQWFASYIKSYPFKAIISGSDGSFRFIKDNFDELFSEMNIIILSVDSPEKLEFVQNNSYVTGIVERFHYEENILIAKRLFPATRKIIFVGASDEIQNEVLRQTDAFTHRYGLSFEYQSVENMTKSGLYSFLKHVQKETVILSLLTEETLKKAPVGEREFIEIVKASSVVPVLSCNNFGFGTGFLGGYFSSYVDMGAAAGNMANLITNRNQLQVIPVDSTPKCGYFFDVAQMKKNGIFKNRLPDNTFFINDNESRGFSLAIVIFWIVLTLVIIGTMAYFFIKNFIEKISLSQSILEERNKFNAVIDQSDTLCWECDFENDDEVLQHQKEDEESDDGLLEITPSESSDIAQGWIDTGIIPDEYRDQYNQVIKELKNGKQFVQIDLPLGIEDIHTHIENVKWKRIVYRAIKTVNGRVLKALGTATDITTQKRAEDQYNGIMAYRSFVSRDYPAYTRLNLTRNIVMERLINIPDLSRQISGNEADKELEALSKMISTNHQNVGFAASIDRMELLTAFVNGAREKECDFFYQFSNQSIRWFTLGIELTSNPYTGNIEAYCNLQDITNEKVALISKDSVLDEEVEFIFWLDVASLFCRFIHRTKDAAWIPDENEIAYDRLIDLFVDKVVNEKEEGKIHKHFILNRVLSDLKEKNSIDFTFQTKDSEKGIRIKQIKIYYLKKNSNVIVYICRDITDITLQEKMQNEKLSRAIKSAELANNAKSDFLSRMSHDLRTPMNGIIGISELAENEIDDPQAILEDLRKIKSSSKYMVGLLNDILDMSKIESGKMEIRQTICSAGELIESINMLASGLCEKNGIDYYCNKDSNSLLTYFLNMDKLHCQQIIMNLISNASKYTPAGGRIEFLVDVIDEYDNQVDLMITISDTGSGMSEDFQKIMYDAFTQDSNSVNKVGTGLGLAIVHNLVSLMNGRIECKSAPGEGTTFKIFLTFERVYPDIEKAEIESKDSESQEQITLEGKNVLLVEDNALNQEIARRLLTKQGMNVQIADNGLIALNTFSEAAPGTYDIILMDVMMPVMDGLESAHLLRSLEREDAKKIPIIAMTANAFQEDVDRCLAAGMNTHIAKPIEPDLLLTTLRKYLKEASEN